MTAWQVDRTGTRPFDLHSADSPRLIVTARQGCSAWICKHANHPPWPHWLRRSPETCARPCCGAICHPCPDAPLAGLRDWRPLVGLDIDNQLSPAHPPSPACLWRSRHNTCILARRTFLTPGALRLNTTSAVHVHHPRLAAPASRQPEAIKRTRSASSRTLTSTCIHSHGRLYPFPQGE